LGQGTIGEGARPRDFENSSLLGYILNNDKLTDSEHIYHVKQRKLLQNTASSIVFAVKAISDLHIK
jgi:hypothetical protein